MKLVWSVRAKRNLFEIASYIAADNPDAAISWTDRLRERVRQAAAMLRAGRLVPEARSENVREVFLQSYRVVYRVEPRQIVVLTVFEGHRAVTSELED
jgi:addiction module RelE/StbE family toxin